MNSKVLIGIVVVFAIALVFGCVTIPKNITSKDSTVLKDSSWTSQGINAVAEANNKFAIDLYKKYSTEFENQNIFFSPYSISSAFAMVYEGARGRTAEEIKNVFYFPGNTSELRTSFAHIYNLINAGSTNYTLRTANALWVQKDFPISTEYLSIVRNYYGGDVVKVDFKNNPSGANQMINKWMDKQTKGKIKDISLHTDLFTRFIITNAVYFKGNWSHQFDKNATHKENFTTSNGNISVDTMHIEEDFPYYEDNEVQVLELPYRGKLSMVIFLPKGNLSDFESNLSLEKMNDVLNNLYTEDVIVYLPKFKFEKGYDLTGDLSSMGIKTPFSANANFSGVSKLENLFIQDVIHKTYIDVNEEGTEAAAVTAVSMSITSALSPPPKIFIFRANHPFVFLIMDKRADEILFMGRVTNPEYS